MVGTGTEGVATGAARGGAGEKGWRVEELHCKGRVGEKGSKGVATGGARGGVGEKRGETWGERGGDWERRVDNGKRRGVGTGGEGKRNRDKEQHFLKGRYQAILEFPGEGVPSF